MANNEVLSAKWRSIRNQIDTILLASQTIKPVELLARCQSLDNMTTEERQIHIKEHWGVVYLEKLMPLLAHLEAVERFLRPKN